MKISIITAVDENNLIGNKNNLPWSMPADLKHFKDTTMGHHIVFGQRTFESIGRPLPGRTNIVLSDDPDYKSEGIIAVNTPEEAVKYAERNKEKELFICGGAMVYKTFLPSADKIYLTKIHHKFKGDIYFPKINLKMWRITSEKPFKPDSKNPYPYDFIILEK